MVGAVVAVLAVAAMAVAGFALADDHAGTGGGSPSDGSDAYGTGDGLGSMVVARLSGAPRYRVSGEVVESPAGGFGPHAGVGPRVCWGPIADVLPPRCGAVGLTSWDWDAVRGWKSYEGVRYGTYELVGTYDREAKTFALTEPPVPVDEAPEPARPPDDTWCDPPAGGWPKEGDHHTGETSLRRLKSAAQDAPDFVSIRKWELPHGPDIWGIRFTGDLTRHERELRAVWGGGLCLRLGPRPAGELEAARDRAEADLESEAEAARKVGGPYPVAIDGVPILGLGSDPDEGRVWVLTEVPVPGGAERLAARWGIPVRVETVLKPAR